MLCACESIGERGERIAFNCVILIIHRRRNYVFTAFLERRKPSETHLKKIGKKNKYSDIFEGVSEFSR